LVTAQAVFDGGRPERVVETPARPFVRRRT
jgi:hypothetical protein